MKKDQLRLFRVVRKGYDPEEVLECFWDIVTAFSTREKQYSKAEEAYLRENIELKTQVDEGQACIRSLQDQVEQLRRENMKLGQRPPPGAAAVKGGGGA